MPLPSELEASSCWPSFMVLEGAVQACRRMVTNSQSNSNMTVVGITNHPLFGFEACDAEQGDFTSDTVTLAREITVPSGDKSCFCFTEGT